MVGRGGDGGGGTRAHVWSAVYRSIERALRNRSAGFGQPETTAARHVVAATLTNSSAFRRRLLRRGLENDRLELDM